MKYDAFISYRHLPKDMYVAKRVHKSLESVKIPRKIQKETGRKRINRVFRDQEELPIGSDLGSNIESALSQAEFLVVICSPQTKESYWVNKEIDTFIAMHGRKNVLAVLVEGRPSESFPPQLLTDENGERIEPLAADVRADSKKEVNRKLKTEVLRLAASILHVDYDDLKQRHREQQMHRRFSIAAIVAAVAIAFCGVIAYNLAQINQEYQAKLINESKVLAAKSLEVLETGDRRTAALIAMEALPTEENDRPFVANAQYALSEALGSYSLGWDMVGTGLMTGDLPVYDYALSSDASRVISYDSASTVYLWDVDNVSEITKITASYFDGEQDGIEAVGFVGETNQAVYATNNFLASYDADGNEIYKVEYEYYTTAARIDDNGQYVLVQGGDIDMDYLYVYDAASGELLKKYEDSLGYGFFCDMAVSDDGKYVAIDSFNVMSDDEENYVTVFNLETDEFVSFKTADVYVLSMAFTIDGYIAIDTTSHENFYSFGTTPMTFQKIDYTTGEVVWEQILDNESGILNSACFNIIDRILVVDGEEHPQIAIGGSQCVYLMDLTTGELIQKYNCSGYVQRIGFNPNNEKDIMYIGTDDGNITVYETLSNEEKTNSTITIDCEMMDYKLKNSVLVIREYMSPSLLIMKSDEDETYLAQNSIDFYYLSSPGSSPDESTYLIIGYTTDDDSSYKYYLYDSATDELLDTFSLEDSRNSGVEYIDNNTIVIPTYDGRVAYYDIDSGEITQEKYVDDESSGTDFILSNNNQYEILYTFDGYFVVDLNSREVINTGEVEEHIKTGVLTDDGSTLYFIDYNDVFYKLDLASGECTTLSEEYHVTQVMISPDNTLLALPCADGMLRILNTSSEAFVKEIEYHCTISSYAEFSDDNKFLYLQGDDLYFKIYDMDSDEYVLSTTDQMNEIYDIVYDEASNTLAVHNQSEMLIIDVDTMGILTEAEYGKIYIPSQQKIVSARSTTVETFKVKTLEDLLAQAEELYGDYELTDEQRLKYNLE